MRAAWLLATPEQVRALDQRTIEQVGVPSVVLMERASLAAVDALARAAGALEGQRVGVLCGGGNNGGDGLAMARIMAERGALPHVFLLVDPSRLAGDAAVNLTAARGWGVPITHLEDVSALAGFEASWWIDALLGTGLDRPVSGLFADVISWLNARSPGVRVLSVDVPSGVHGGTGQVMGCAVRADHTVTFAAMKVGCAVQPARALCGALEVADIGIPPAVVREVGVTGRWLADGWGSARLGLRPRAMHKGAAGRVVVVGGSEAMTGALLLAARGAIEGGAGLVTAVTTQAVCGRVALAVPEVMAVAGLGGADELALLDEASGRADVIVAGMGMGTSEAARLAVERVLSSRARLVLDADALNLIATHPALAARLEARGEQAILTPHPGEMARLCGCGVSEVEAAPVELARGLAARWGVVVVLKLSTAVIAAPDGRLAVSGVGNPGMASAGMGDALSGLMSARLAEEADAFEAACVAVYQHGRAGDVAAGRVGQRALTASLVLDAAREVLRELEVGR
jgi:NAD(P)H-hydrate epimerase